MEITERLYSKAKISPIKARNKEEKKVIPFKAGTVKTEVDPRIQPFEKKWRKSLDQGTRRTMWGMPGYMSPIYRNIVANQEKILEKQSAKESVPGAYRTVIPDLDNPVKKSKASLSPSKA